MERLHAALEKARAKREALEPGHAPRVKGQPRPKATESVAAAWAELSPLVVKERKLVRNRVITLSGGSEAAPYDMLRTKVLQKIQTEGWRRLALISPHSACGKSTTVANLAFSLGRQKELRTLVLDFDLRRMGLAKILGQKMEHSMADVLERRVAFKDHGLRYEDNVAFGLNFGTVKNPSEILQSRKTIDVISEIEAMYKPDFVLIDTPPLMASDDSYGFLKNVDCALLIVAAEQTSMAEIDVAERQLAELTKVMGIVLNKCRYTDGAHGYEYGYY
jgi:Mrp family chromosome partitioning ATPase